ncbi:FAD-dependent oxidoreductase [Streptomyces uncialis]|uniref:FAD-dependent oxidoreductase n=1 Tax=Streptomyces uncialis TaxID=1048205 RepID=UPI0037F28892
MTDIGEGKRRASTGLHADQLKGVGLVLGMNAVVLGGGMSGLMAAHVLAGHFERVTLVERDGGGSADPRRGVPQGWHPHVLALKAAPLLERLFPGLGEEFIASGGLRVGMLDQHRINYYGHQFRQSESELETVWASRPFLEEGIRSRVGAHTNVSTRFGWEAVTPISGPPGRVTGVRIARIDDGEAEDLTAELVVDATGRGGRAQAWLGEMGYEAPREDRVQVNLGYASRLVECAPDVLGHDRAIVVGPKLDRPRGFYFTVQEAGQWTMTVFGYGDHRPSVDPDRLMAQAEALAPPDVWEVIRSARVSPEVHSFQVPRTFRRRYDRLSRFPEGLLVTGDALAVLNPLYGTGIMSSAAYALVLQERLREGLDGIHRGFFRDAARVVLEPWLFSSLSDSFLPGVKGFRAPGSGVASWYLRRMVAAAQHDATVAAAFVRVAGALDSPLALARPAIMRRVIGPRKG